MSIKKTIAIASAKGGVGKSSITSLLAKKLSRDFSIGILDADIYGPNQHIIFDVVSAKPEIIEEDHKKRFIPFRGPIKLTSWTSRHLSSGVSRILAPPGIPALLHK